MELQLVQQLKAVNGYLMFNASSKIDVTGVSIEDVFVVDDVHEHRLHLISMHIYNTDNMVDVLMVFNNITNPFYIPAGTNINIPSIAEIDHRIGTFIKENSKKASSSISQKSVSSKQTESSNTILSDGRIIFRKR